MKNAARQGERAGLPALLLPGTSGISSFVCLSRSHDFRFTDQIDSSKTALAVAPPSVEMLPAGVECLVG